jgi:predicted transcriptional regulator of viral defense system
MPGESAIVDKVLKLAKKTGILRIKDLALMGIHPEYVRRLTVRGLLVRSGRGLYILPDADVTENHTLAEACKRVPQGVVCLLSALRFHNIGTQMPHEVWLAIDRNASRPRVDYPPLRIMRFSGQALTEGVEVHNIEEVKVKVYSPAKTVVDCFKYRNKTGLDVALEALRYCWHSRRCMMDEFWHFANICRVANVMRPYLESLV